MPRTKKSWPSTFRCQPLPSLVTVTVDAESVPTQANAAAPTRALRRSLNCFFMIWRRGAHSTMNPRAAAELSKKHPVVGLFRILEGESKNHEDQRIVSTSQGGLGDGLCRGGLRHGGPRLCR